MAGFVRFGLLLGIVDQNSRKNMVYCWYKRDRKLYTFFVPLLVLYLSLLFIGFSYSYGVNYTLLLATEIANSIYSSTAMLALFIYRVYININRIISWITTIYFLFNPKHTEEDFVGFYTRMAFYIRITGINISSWFRFNKYFVLFIFALVLSIICILIVMDYSIASYINADMEDLTSSWIDKATNIHEVLREIVKKATNALDKDIIAYPIPIELKHGISLDWLYNIIHSTNVSFLLYDSAVIDGLLADPYVYLGEGEDPKLSDLLNPTRPGDRLHDSIGAKPPKFPNDFVTAKWTDVTEDKESEHPLPRSDVSEERQLEQRKANPLFDEFARNRYGDRVNSEEAQIVPVDAHVVDNHGHPIKQLDPELRRLALKIDRGWRYLRDVKRIRTKNIHLGLMYNEHILNDHDKRRLEMIYFYRSRSMPTPNEFWGKETRNLMRAGPGLARHLRKDHNVWYRVYRKP